MPALCGLFAGASAQHMWPLLGDGVGAEEQGRSHAQSGDGERLGKSLQSSYSAPCLLILGACAASLVAESSGGSFDMFPNVTAAICAYLLCWLTSHAT